MKKTERSEELRVKSEKYKFREFEGITLISLVITIIILIILTGVGINLALGENGIFNKAKYAKEKYINAQSLEEQQLNELYEQLGLMGELPENTSETKAGTVVRMPNNWYTTTAPYVSTETGKEVVVSKKVASVYAVSTGDGKSVPVPIEFYYVGGTLESGIVISDNKEDKNKYVGKEDVGKDLKGNQFVWIPCSISDYHKISFGENTYDNGQWNRETNSMELPQIEKYGGFYIGRYEAGVGTLNKEKEKKGEANPFDYTVTFENGKSLFNSVEIETGINNWEWQNYNFTAKREGIPVTNVANKANGNVVVKADSIPYYHANYYTSVEMSRRLYSNHKYVKSTLVTGTMWDVMIKYMEDNGVNVKSSNWGNYDNVTLTNLSGYYTSIAKETKNGKTTGETDGFKSSKTLTTNNEIGSYVMLTTGSSEQVKKMNIYDVAGNLWEWTEEASYGKALANEGNINNNTYIIRGGSFANEGEIRPACYRAYFYAPNTNTDRGFRVALYLQ